MYNRCIREKGLNVSLQVDDFLQTDFIPYLQIAIRIFP